MKVAAAERVLVVGSIVLTGRVSIMRQMSGLILCATATRQRALADGRPEGVAGGRHDCGGRW